MIFDIITLLLAMYGGFMIGYKIGLSIRRLYFKYKRRICAHSFIKAQGVGGGHIFKYCNKCGHTKP